MSVSTSAPVVGQWTGTVTHDGEVDEYTVTFDQDGSLSITTQKSTGSGSWAVTGDKTFEFTIREDFNTDVNQISPNGHRAAYIQIDIAAERDGDTFNGTGKAVVHGPDDVVIYATDAATDARRVS